MSKTALVIMAAGLASRYGGNKQIEGMGPNGEILMEYSIIDAIRAGFTKVVLIIRREMQERMNELLGDRFKDRIEICYAYQDFSSIPDFYQVPEARVKPFGTVHAVLCARPYIEEPFAVINADDYYGVESFAQMYEFLIQESKPGCAAMMGYRLKNTVSKHGAVTRGLCCVENGWLSRIQELPKVQQREDGSIWNTTNDAQAQQLDADSPVSMNFWGFPAQIFEAMSARFDAFLKNIAPDDLRAEFLLPVMVDQMITDGQLNIRVLETSAVWFGVTIKEDRPGVVQSLQKLHDQGVY